MSEEKVVYVVRQGQFPEFWWEQIRIYEDREEAIRAAGTIDGGYVNIPIIPRHCHTCGK